MDVYTYIFIFKVGTVLPSEVQDKPSSAPRLDPS